MSKRHSVTLTATYPHLRDLCEQLVKSGDMWKRNLKQRGFRPSHETPATQRLYKRVKRDLREIEALIYKCNVHFTHDWPYHCNRMDWWAQNECTDRIDIPVSVLRSLQFFGYLPDFFRAFPAYSCEVLHEKAVL